ncbi:hypothetical protein ACP275_13G124900 [Erythranthe tilingii]
MAKQQYGYTTSTYGGGSATTSIYKPRSADTSLLGATSRYLSDSLTSSSAMSSSMLYAPESYSTRIPGVSAHSHGPPGVDAASTDALYNELKRASTESLYHQTLLDAHNKGLTEAWYSTNPLAKRPRYDSTSHLPVYPQRPGEKDCAFYMQTRTCKFGESCRFDHPIWVPEGGIPDWKEVPPVPSECLPERPGDPDCPYFLKTQRCKFGIRCRFNHPKDRIVSLGATEDDGTYLPERPSEPPCAFYMKTGSCKFGPTCKFHHPKGVPIQPAGEEIGAEVQTSLVGDGKTVQQPFAPALVHNTKGLPIRPGEENCPFYLKTNSCKYGATCRYNHPDRYTAIAPTLMTSPSAHYNYGVVAPTASLLSAYDPMLTQTALGLSPAFYPQRPGQLECDYYMKTGICKFGITCKFHHPLDRSTTSVAATYSTESLQENVKLTLAGLPRREGAIHCPYYMKTGTCKFGATCRFDHPPPGEVMAVPSAEEQQNGDA